MAVVEVQRQGSTRIPLFTLAKAGAYAWSMPCCAIGHTAEKLAGDLDEGMPVLISAAELCYRKRATKSGEIEPNRNSRLACPGGTTRPRSDDFTGPRG